MNDSGISPKDAAERTAVQGRIAARAAAATLEAPDGWWIVTGGPQDVHAAETLRAQFRSLAVEAAVLAGVAPRTDDLDLVQSAWLDKVASNGAGFVRYSGGMIKQLPEASAVLCMQLRAEALRQGLAVGDIANTADGTAASPFPNRAVWLRRAISEAGTSWTTLNQLHGGPSSKTVKKIQEGMPVGNAVLVKVAAALTSAGRPTLRKDIPND